MRGPALTTDDIRHYAAQGEYVTISVKRTDLTAVVDALELADNEGLPSARVDGVGRFIEVAEVGLK